MKRRPLVKFLLLPGTGGHVFNLKTTGLTTGTYVLIFRAGGDPPTRTVQFQIK